MQGACQRLALAAAEKLGRRNYIATQKICEGRKRLVGSAARFVRQAGLKRKKLKDEKMLGSGCFNHRWQDNLPITPLILPRHCRQDATANPFLERGGTRQTYTINDRPAPLANRH
jgi:hypothetical protein